MPLKVSVQYYTSCGDVYHAYNWEVLTFESVDEILKCDQSNESDWAVLSCGAVNYEYMVLLTFESVDEILKCDHSNERYWAVLSYGAVYYAVRVKSVYRSFFSFCQ